MLWNLLLFLLTSAIVGSDATWCVCRSDQSQTALQKVIDYACGAGADCTSILQNGPCYNPNTVLAHCSYAANSYYQRNGQAQTACDFSGAATITISDPSYVGCTYPSTSSGSATPNTPPIQNGTPTTANSPPTLTPPGYGALGPAGASFDNSAVVVLPKVEVASAHFLCTVFSALVFGDFDPI